MFRASVLHAAKWQCQFILEDGERCTERVGLEAHHVRGFRETGDMSPHAGVALCRPHHEAAEAALEQDAGSLSR
jgi:predicted restriction endonuclease